MSPPHVFSCTWTGTEGEPVLGDRLFPLDGLRSPMHPHIRHCLRQLT